MIFLRFVVTNIVKAIYWAMIVRRFALLVINGILKILKDRQGNHFFCIFVPHPGC